MTLNDQQNEFLYTKLESFGYSPNEIAIVKSCFTGESIDFEPDEAELQVANQLVNIADYNLKGSSFYYEKMALYDLDEQKCQILGIKPFVQVSDQIISDLLAAQLDFQKDGYQLFVKEGYRSKLTYAYVYIRKALNSSKAEADRIYNPLNRPHGSGMAVDLVLFHNGKQVKMRDAAAGDDGLFYGCYDHLSTFSLFQEYLIAVMRNHKFNLASKGEYFHFNHRHLGAEPYVAFPIRFLAELRAIGFLDEPIILD